MRTSTTRTVDPTVEPLSLSEAKTHLRLETSDEDVLARRLIEAARDWAENFTRRSLVTQTWKLYMDAFPSVIELQRPPVQSVTTVEYVDDDGDTQTLSSSLYDVDTDALLPRIYPAYGEVWPSVRIHPKAVTVTYVAGYGSSETSVPEAIRAAMLLQVSRLYEVREPDVIGTSITPTDAELALLRPYQIAGF